MKPLSFSKKVVLQEKFREMFKRQDRWEVMSVILQVSTRTLIEWKKDLGLMRPRIKQSPHDYNEDGTKKECSWKECSVPIFSRGYCQSHYNTARKQGLIQRQTERLPRITPYFSHINRHCDHSSSRCECINPGKDYQEFLRDG